MPRKGNKGKIFTSDFTAAPPFQKPVAFVFTISNIDLRFYFIIKVRNAAIAIITTKTKKPGLWPGFEGIQRYK